MRRKTHKKQKLSAVERKQKNLQRLQKKTVTTTLTNMGFSHISGVDGKNIVFKGRTTEMDDMFVYKNLILLVEYTIDSNPGTHLLKKNYFYERVNENNAEFINQLLLEERFTCFKNYFDEKIEPEYSVEELMVKVLYCSHIDISDEHIRLVNPAAQNENVIIYDKNISRYFSLMAKGIKRSAIYEFFEFMSIPLDKVNLERKGGETTYDGYLLPETRSKFNTGYKVLTFYIDAETLLHRSNVFRQNSWRDTANGASYQRIINATKIGKMREYLYNEKRVFVNNIIGSVSIDDLTLSFNDMILDFDDNGSVKNMSITDVIPVKIKIKDKCNIIRLIDGQHRTYSYFEGDDKYEQVISVQRKKQNLLLTIVVFPKITTETARVQFEAQLFQEINSEQTNVSSNLTQEIACLLNPFSTTAIAKKVLQNLARRNRTLVDRVMLNPLDGDSALLKTASIVSYGLSPLIKVGEGKDDSIYAIWDNPDKALLKDAKDYKLLEQYIDFCVSIIDELLSAVKMNLNTVSWTVYSKKNPTGFLSVTSVNGLLNLLRLLIQNNLAMGRDYYKERLHDIEMHDIRKYKSSQYRSMGVDLYDAYFKQR